MEEQNEIAFNRQYLAELEEWRRHMDESLRSELSWLALAGLFWLQDGPNTIGSDPASDVALPQRKAPLHVGVLHKEAQGVWMEPAPGVDVRVNGEPCERRLLRDDTQPTVDQVSIGSITFVVLQRGARVGIRVWDRTNPRRQSFEGRRWYEPQAAFRVAGRFERHDPPGTIDIPNVLGDVEARENPGAVAFTIDGRALRLEGVASGERSLFIIFRDQTSGNETYGVGRFLYLKINDDDTVEVDFNRAYNPPCAFTEYATCPMPPRANHLPVAIRAGELDTGHH
ncbi:MAG TPA: DUF1684 domain-containing protein [Roseiflexaceae bacterium]|nr:DUF1684 domain-containing protein [Roseiflexaceae bacterium]